MRQGDRLWLTYNGGKGFFSEGKTIVSLFANLLICLYGLSSIIWLVGQFFLPQSNRTRRDHNRGFVPGVRSFATSFADLESWPGGSSIPQLPSNLLPAFLPSCLPGRKHPRCLGNTHNLPNSCAALTSWTKVVVYFHKTGTTTWYSTFDVVFYATSSKTNVCTNQNFLYSQTCQAL